MPLITDYHHVREEYARAAELGVALPVFCAEDRETLEAILSSVMEYGKQIGVDDLPVVPAWTSRYPGRAQMTLVTAAGDPVVGIRLMFSDLEILAGEAGPYGKLKVMPHLDHAYPWLDGDVMVDFADKFASVMCDASEKNFEENIRLTAEYVEKVKGRVVVEGAVDEIFEAGVATKNETTSVDQAQRFLRETGVDIIVPNVGTEHRSTSDTVVYQRARAREISSSVGRILCLHGTSSVKQEDLTNLPEDGFVKVNIYTTLAVNGGQAVARKVLEDIGDIFTEAEIRDYIKREVLTERLLALASADGRRVGPKLAAVANPPRRDEWYRAVKNRCQDFLGVFNYRNFVGLRS